MDSSQRKLLCTPRRAQKCLFAPSDDKSGKTSIFQDSGRNRDDKTSSGDESDLGPMSPLALTDRSPSISDLSSSGREFISPFTTPEKPIVHNTSWDRLRFNTEERMSPFRSLRKVTRAARYSPRCRLFPGDCSPRSVPSTPDKLTDPLTPQRSKRNVEQMNEIVPETPQRSFATEIQNQNITETPRKGRTPEIKQITPLSSISKTVLLPKLHRRKSFSTIETSEGFSPEQKENTLKRRARDQSAAKPTKLAKLFKADDSSAPKARASLFQEKKNECCSLKEFSLSTKTFYSNGNMKSERPFSNFRTRDVKRRRSLPLQSNSRRSSVKKRKFGINAGVGHGIKKPKPKVNTEILKKEGQHVTQNSTASSKSPPMEKVQPMEANVERPPSPVIDENKRFFKTNKTIRLNHAATVTVNNKIKLKVTDGKIVLKDNPKRVLSTNPYKQNPKAMDISLDATDLTVDEPEVEATLQYNKVDDLLKILDNDWGNDDYDTMGPLTQIANAFSPLKSVLQKDAIMSPATELSNMTSTMNIKDVAPLKNFGNLSLDNANNNNDIEKEIGEKKRYFPLFSKGYSVPDNIFEYVPEL